MHLVIFSSASVFHDRLGLYHITLPRMVLTLHTREIGAVDSWKLFQVALAAQRATIVVLGYSPAHLACPTILATPSKPAQLMGFYFW